MPRQCAITSKKTRAGFRYSRRGKAKYLGGVGRKVTSRTKRTFKPNLQKVRALVGGRVVRLTVSAKVIGQGLVVKPLKRTWKPAAPEGPSPKGQGKAVEKTPEAAERPPEEPPQQPAAIPR